MCPHVTVSILAIGLLSAVHCSGMCAGIMGALSLSLPPELRGHRLWRAGYVLLFNLGRLLTYAGLGALAGAAGFGLFDTLPPHWATAAVRGIVATVLVLVGLHLSGLLPRLTRLESLGAPLWRLVEPLGRRLLPVRSPAQALLYGMVWGFLPCTLVYAMLLMALSAGGPWEGAQSMALFWLGSLPAMLAAGTLAQTLARLTRRPLLRPVGGLALVLSGLASLLMDRLMPAAGLG
jgi:sulfite exporter TauE/SafE